MFLDGGKNSRIGAFSRIAQIVGGRSAESKPQFISEWGKFVQNSECAIFGSRIIMNAEGLIPELKPAYDLAKATEGLITASIAVEFLSEQTDVFRTLRRVNGTNLPGNRIELPAESFLFGVFQRSGSRGLFVSNGVQTELIPVSETSFNGYNDSARRSVGLRALDAHARVEEYFRNSK